MNLETLAIHVGRDPDPVTGEVAPAIRPSTTFRRGSDGELVSGHMYSRASNPGRAALERLLAALEGGTAACAFASGTAASLAIFQALAPGDHVVYPKDVYHGTRLQLRELMSGWGLTADAVNLDVPGALAAALRPNTRLVLLETPSNPMLRVTDIAEACRVAHAAGARVAVDNTFATPVLQRPLALGADLVLHSTSKYLGGHSDLVGGAVIGREDDALFQRIRMLQWAGGGVPSAFDCWLLQRSIATLPCRVRGQTANAGALARFLTGHRAVSAVHYPGLPKHPNHAVARAQMSDFGAMLSVQLAGGRDAATAVAGGLELFTRATSLGGVESLVEHRAAVEGPDTATPQDLLRVSVGLEHADDLLADFGRALDALPR